MKAGKSDRKNNLLLVFSIVFSLVILEIGLRLLTPFPIHGELANRVAHPVLGYTLDPADREIDADGFRNPVADGSYDIVVIGDSHTQGFNVASGESMPSLLAGMLGMTVYNAGVGGYNIYQYPYLAELAREKSPAIVLLALLPSNDLLRNIPDTEYLAGIPGLELQDVPVKTVKDRLEHEDVSPGDMLKSHLAIVSVVSYLNNKRTSNKASYHDVGGQAIKKDRVASHRKYTDLSAPVVASSFRNSLAIINYINNHLKQAGIQFGIVIIPSKELILQTWAQAGGITLPEGFHANNEAALIDAWLEYFNRSAINYIDATPFVLSAFQADTQSARIFYPRGDGHPFASGYQSYALAAATLVRKIDEERKP